MLGKRSNYTLYLVPGHSRATENGKSRDPGNEVVRYARDWSPSFISLKNVSQMSIQVAIRCVENGELRLDINLYMCNKISC